MTLVTVMVATPMALLGHRAAWSGPGLRLATGVLSVGFGLYVMLEVGFIDGLFGAAPQWRPR
jgi:hypothetical protein